MIVKLITGSFYIYFLVLASPENAEQCSFLFLPITYLFILGNLVDFSITTYIILYKNEPVKDFLMTLCHNCLTKAAPALGALHMSSNVPMVSPNPITNQYHLSSPVGRGYGAHSSMQLLQVDLLKTELGGNFDYHQCIDDKKFLHPQKMQAYSQKCGINLKQVTLNHNHYW